MKEHRQKVTQLCHARINKITRFNMDLNKSCLHKCASKNWKRESSSKATWPNPSSSIAPLTTYFATRSPFASRNRKPADLFSNPVTGFPGIEQKDIKVTSVRLRRHSDANQWMKLHLHLSPAPLSSHLPSRTLTSLNIGQIIYRTRQSWITGWRNKQVSSTLLCQKQRGWCASRNIDVPRDSQRGRARGKQQEGPNQDREDEDFGGRAEDWWTYPCNGLHDAARKGTPWLRSSEWTVQCNIEGAWGGEVKRFAIDTCSGKNEMHRVTEAARKGAWQRSCNWWPDIFQRFAPENTARGRGSFAFSGDRQPSRIAARIKSANEWADYSG